MIACIPGWRKRSIFFALFSSVITAESFGWKGDKVSLQQEAEQTQSVKLYKRYYLESLIKDPFVNYLLDAEA